MIFFSSNNKCSCIIVHNIFKDYFQCIIISVYFDIKIIATFHLLKVFFKTISFFFEGGLLPFIMTGTILNSETNFLTETN